MRIFAFLLSIAMALSLGTPALARVSDGAAALTRLIGTKSIDPSVLSKTFTDAVPVATLQSIVDDYRARLGTFTAVTTSGTDYKVAFSTGAVLATLSLDSSGAIDKLLFHDETSPIDLKALDRLFLSKEPLAGWFTPAFLSQVSPAELSAGLQQFATQEGAFEHIELRDGAYYAVYAKAMNHVNVMTDGQGRITYLFIQAPVANTVSLNDALAKLTSGSGSVSYVILKGDRQIAAHFADRPEAVGSAFKLVVLAALRSQIDAKRHGWTDVVALPAADKSLPSGTFQAWPDNTPITLATYAAQMISISDNTAADVLANVVGRSALEALSPRNAPFLRTREMFALKTRNAALRDAYRTASLSGRRAILAKLDAAAAPSIGNLDLSPADLDIEWHLSNRELCSLMDRVQDLDLMTINPGVSAGNWARIAYKGGSDAGVLNFTSYLTAPGGATYCVSATWNDRAHPIDEASRVAAYGAVLKQLSNR
jgi:beta-lactamase class A